MLFEKLMRIIIKKLWKGESIMTLKDGQIGDYYIVKDLKLEQQIRRRLEALGLIGGTKIQLMNRNLDGSVVFKVRGTRLAIGNKIAEAIGVEEAAI